MQTIGDILSPDFVHARMGDRVEQVLEVMTRQQINTVPVMDDAGSLRGILVRSDIYRFMIDPGHYSSCPVEWVMTKNVVTARLEDSLAETALRLLDHRIEAMPVLDGDRVVGVVSKADLLRHFAMSDASRALQS